MRTTSVLEGMHSVIQRTFPTKPHILKFIESLRLHEATKSSDLIQLLKGNIIQQIRAEDRERAQKIKKFTEDLEAELISVEIFLDKMSKSKPNSSTKKLKPSVGEFKFKY